MVLILRPAETFLPVLSRGACIFQKRKRPVLSTYFVFAPFELPHPIARGCGCAWAKTSCSYSMAFSQPRKGHAWIPGVVLVRALQKRCTEPGVGDRCISDASETREVLDRNLAIHRCKQSLAQASWYWFVCLENVMDAWWEISELKEISTVPKVYIVLWDSIYRLTTYGPSKLIFPGVLSFYIF